MSTINIVSLPYHLKLDTSAYDPKQTFSDHELRYDLAGLRPTLQEIGSVTTRLYTGLGSGNSYKVELMLHLLAVAYDPISVSIPKGEHRDPEFLKITPFGQIPVLVDGDKIFTDSQAILCYLARAYGASDADRWLPIDPAPLAMVMRWLSFAANEIQNGPTMARAAKLLGWSVDYERAVALSYRLLDLMNHHLGGADWLATDNATIADIACYPYIFLAEEGGVDTSSFSKVTAWMGRLETLPKFWPMPRIPNLPKVPLTSSVDFSESI